MDSKILSFKTIKYYLYGNTGKKLIVILPRAGAEVESHKKLISLLEKRFDVMFVDAGYLGKNAVYTDNFGLYRPDNFSRNLGELIVKLGHKEVSVLAESVGALYAIFYQLKYGNFKKLYLSNPAVYKPGLLSRYLGLPLLKISVKTSPDLFFKLMKKFCLNVPIFKTNLSSSFAGVENTVGARSYFLCLQEISEFGLNIPKEIDKVLEKSVVLVGKKDKIFKGLCNEELFRKANTYKELEGAEHRLIDSQCEFVDQIIRS